MSEIIWNPRVGATGDDRYLLPPRSKWLAGLFNAASGTGINQVIAQHNALIGQINAVKSTGLTPLPQMQSGQPMIASETQTLKTSIDSLRLAFNASAFSWSTVNSVATGVKIDNLVMKELRKSISDLQTATVPVGSGISLTYGTVPSSTRFRYDYVYTGAFTPSLQFGFDGWRKRLYRPFTTSEFATHVAGTFDLQIVSSNTSYSSSDTIKVYLLPNNGTPGQADWNDTGTLLCSTPVTITLPETQSLVPITIDAPVDPSTAYYLKFVTEGEAGIPYVAVDVGAYWTLQAGQGSDLATLTCY